MSQTINLDLIRLGRRKLQISPTSFAVVIPKMWFENLPDKNVDELEFFMNKDLDLIIRPVDKKKEGG